MRFSIVAGRVYSAMRVVGGCRWDTTRDANRDVAGGPDCARSNSQSVAPASRSSQNTFKTPVVTGVVIVPRANLFSQASQSLSQSIARMILARKERSAFGGKGGVVGHEPGARFGHFVRRWAYALKRFALVLFLTLSAAAQACIYQGSTTPCPADCIEDGGKIMCIRPVPAPSPGQDWLETDGEKWRYGNYHSNYPGHENSYGPPWCAAQGGTWGFFPEINIYQGSCKHSLGGAHPPPGLASYFAEGLVGPQAQLHANEWSPCGAATQQLDTGWGTEDDGTFVSPGYPRGTLRISGIEVFKWRRFEHLAKIKTNNICQGETYLIKVQANMRRDAVCPVGYESRWFTTSLAQIPDRVLKCAKITQATCEIPEDQCGNPIRLSTGAKIQTENDYAGASDSLLSLRRTYSSEGFFSSNSSLNVGARNFGRFWRHNYERRVQNVVGNTAISAIAERPDGKLKTFDNAGNEILNFGSSSEKLVSMLNAGQLTGWTYTTSSDDVETYDLNGRLISIAARSGKMQLLIYSDSSTASADAPFSGLLIAVTDDFGRSLRFFYNALGLVRQVTSPNNEVFSYSYDNKANLVQVKWPDQNVRSYIYGEPVNTSNSLLPNALTGIVDENANRFSTYTYKGGLAFSTEHAGGVSKYVVSRQNDTVYVWDPIDTTPLSNYPKRSVNYSNKGGVFRSNGAYRPDATGATAASRTFAYTANGNVERFTDYNNNQTCYQYDPARNLETGRVEGMVSGAACSTAFSAATLSAPARKITTTWHPTYRVPATVTESTSSGTKTTTDTYSASGNLEKRVIATQASTRTWLWSNHDAYGRAGNMTDPRGKITTYTYYPNTAAQNTALANSRGMLKSITNAAGYITAMNAYDANGRVLSMSDANGLVSTMTYHPRGWLLSRTVSGTGINEQTTYDYDGVGQLKKVTMPDSSYMTYDYDGAHRLVKITDTLGNSISYTLDNMGNRTKEEAKDPNGALARSHTREIDALNRLKKDIGATNPTTQITQYGYDNNGNQKSMTDALGRVTDNEYDALNRLKKVTDAATPTRGITQYEYDPQDNLTKVTDAKGLATTYTYNGFNELVSQSSPDTGSTAFTYDAAGNMLTKTDARGVVATYTYDALNRVTTIGYTAYQTDPAETVTYTYDTGCGSTASSKGRLCSLTDNTGTTTCSYDMAGRITAKSQAIAGVAQTIRYRYNAAGQLDEMTLPSAKKVAYTYANNRVTGITYDGTPIVKAGLYEPFGPVGEWVWGNNTAATPNKHTRDYDLDGRLFRIDTGLTNGAIEPSVMLYNGVNQITGLQRLTNNTGNTGNTVNTTKSNSYGYDALDRLTTVTPAAGNPNPALGYSYDAIGNRLTAAVGASTTTYGYGTSNHRLNNLTGANSKTYGYDAVGNRTSDGGQIWNYGGNNRPISVTAGGTTLGVRINALGQRVTKTVNGVLTRFMYDEAGRLLGEYNDTGQPIQETIWFNDLPVAVIK